MPFRNLRELKESDMAKYDGISLLLVYGARELAVAKFVSKLDGRHSYFYKASAIESAYRLIVWESMHECDIS